MNRYAPADGDAPGEGLLVSYIDDRPGQWRRSARTPAGSGSLWMLGAFELIGLGTAAVTLIAAVGAARGWWAATPRVSWAPPVVLVALVRTVLYLLVPVAEWRVWRRRLVQPVGTMLALFVAQQVLATVWPVVFFAGYRWLGLTALGVTVALLLLLDLLLGATVAMFWGVSRIAAVLTGVDLAFALFITALIVGALGEHGYT